MTFELTKITQADWFFFRKLYTDARIMRFVSDPLSDEQIKDAFESRLPKWDLSSSHWLCLVIRRKVDGIPMGLTGLMIVQESCELVAEVGYMIACEFSGKSLATDSLAALLALPELSAISRYQAVVTDGNKASVSVLEKYPYRRY
ncbi:TPA: GNAT family N-acetyltransferase [Providencia rettgeri]|uniref:GNAT family N-acetyltransferase n=1 Tax=Providencia sp. PROV129 TaxID=2949839 RepID=UPI0023495C95|nr:GNAT family N-acetyltransferase [Providencia sp. PROV129]HEC8329415.1 GNAT family N-acetyltransferase [Providencia rettgeri]